MFLKPWNHAKLHGSEISGLTEKTNLSLRFSWKKTFSLLWIRPICLKKSVGLVLSTVLGMKTNAEKILPNIKVDKILKMKFHKFFKDQMPKCLKHLVPKYLKPPSTQIS